MLSWHAWMMVLSAAGWVGCCSLRWMTLHDDERSPAPVHACQVSFQPGQLLAADEGVWIISPWVWILHASVAGPLIRRNLGDVCSCGQQLVLNPAAHSAGMDNG